jgi:hypothetical protein
MSLKCKDGSSRRSACDHCPSAYECGKLYSALEVLGADAARGDPDDAHVALTRILDEAGFGYPWAFRPCAMHTSPDTIRELTAEAIRILDRRRRQRARDAACA